MDSPASHGLTPALQLLATSGMPATNGSLHGPRAARWKSARSRCGSSVMAVRWTNKYLVTSRHHNLLCYLLHTRLHHSLFACYWSYFLLALHRRSNAGGIIGRERRKGNWGGIQIFRLGGITVMMSFRWRISWQRTILHILLFSHFGWKSFSFFHNCSFFYILVMFGRGLVAWMEIQKRPLVHIHSSQILGCLHCFPRICCCCCCLLGRGKNKNPRRKTAYSKAVCK